MKEKIYLFPRGKKKNIGRFCEIKSTASFVPEKVYSNEDIINQTHLPYKSVVIEKSLGVKYRHIAKEEEADSDLLRESAYRCLQEGSVLVEDLSRVLVNKFIGDNLLPMTASVLQRKLMSTRANHAYDIDGGITSFLHGVDVVSRYIATGDEYILLNSGGICNRIVSKTDPRTAFLFGDGTASLLFGVSKEPHILASYFYTNYEYYELATAITPITLVNRGEELKQQEQMELVMDTYSMGNWKEAEVFYRKATEVVSDYLFQESGLRIEDIDLFLVTENNHQIWELTLETLGIYQEKSLSLLWDYGNTMSAMLPMLLDYGLKHGRIEKGMKIMLLSHGEGMSGGGMIYHV